MSTNDSTTIEYWTEKRYWLLARIETQTNPESLAELTGAVDVCDEAIARLEAEGVTQ